MKYIRYFSDIHNDFDADRFHTTKRYDPGDIIPSCEMDLIWYPEKMDTDADTVLILPGDLWVDRRFLTKIHPHTNKSWLHMISEMFKYVVFVNGNHDYWGTNLQFEDEKIRQEIRKQGIENKVIFLSSGGAVLDGVKFVGGTLWTDFKNKDPLLMWDASNMMNDYRKITFGPNYKKVTPKDVLDIHQKTRDFIFSNARKDSPDQKLIVVTHMAPSHESISEEHRVKSTDDNYLYFTELSNQIMDSDIDYWFHGHCHHVSNYMIGNTQVLCNPRGYSGYEDTGYDQFARIEL